MTVHDPAWDMPEEHWQPQSSFQAPITTPLLGPDAGSLVCVPPFNDSWLPIIEGCLDQLRNPATWAAVDDADMSQVLSWVDRLKQLFFQAGPCVSMEMRLTAECGLQFSTDGGATWVDVANWATNFCPCVNSCVTPPVPVFPPGQVVNQHACNIAGYLASEIIERATAKAVSDINAGIDQVKYATDVMSGLAFAFPITNAAVKAFQDLYVAYQSITLSHLTFASTDATLWSEMTCAIYAAIRATGYITSGNYPAIVTNVCALTYTYPPVITAICGWITALGLQNLQAMQQAGALDDVDCSGCDVTWCYYFDFRLNAQGWVLHPLVPNGVYTAGLGWQTVPVGGAIAECVIIIDMGVTVPITAIDVLLSSNQGSTGSHASDVQVDTVPGTAPGFTTFTFPANAPAYAWQDVACVASGRYCAVDVACASSGGGLTTIQAVQVRGKGVNPFGVDNCIH